MYPDLKKDTICKVLESKFMQGKKTVALLDEALLEISTKNECIKTNYELLFSIKGIGMVNALVTIVYTENFQSVPSPRSYAVYVGIIPFEHTAGVSIRGRKRVGSIANKELKKSLTRLPEVPSSGTPK